MGPQVSCIIYSKNTSDLLKNSLTNLADIKNNYYQNLEVIVVDNRSSDKSAEIVTQKFPWVKLIQSEDLGLAASNNLGAKNSIGKYLLFLGADAYPRNDTISNLVDYLEKNNKVGIVTPKLSLQGGNTDMDAHRSFPTPWNAFTRLTQLYKLFPKSKLFNSYFMGHENPNIPHEIDSVVSGFMLMPKSVFDEVGGFDPAYYAYGEDLDFCYRLKKKGYKVMYLPQWESGHVKMTLKNEKAPLEQKIKLAKSSTDAMRLFLKKNYKDIYPQYMIHFINVGIKVIEAQRLSSIILKHIFSSK